MLEQFFTLKHVPGGGALGSLQHEAFAPQSGLQSLAGMKGIGGGDGFTGHDPSFGGGAGGGKGGGMGGGSGGGRQLAYFSQEVLQVEMVGEPWTPPVRLGAP